MENLGWNVLMKRSVVVSHLSDRLPSPLIVIVDKLTIEVLPEELILEIFYFYKLACRRSYGGPKEWEWEWHKLAHVCRKWRTVVFASQRRLDLRLLCTTKTSIQQTLDLWPAFPIIVKHTWSLDGWDNTIAALGPAP
jgi:hypothetical protein